MIRLLKLAQNLLRGALLKFWIQPIENYLRTISLDYSASDTRLVATLAWLKDLGWLLMTLGRVNVKRIEGADWSVTFIGEDFTHSEKELRGALFRHPPREVKLHRTFIWQIPRRMPQFLSESDLVVWELNRLIRWQPRGTAYFFRSPPWIRMKLAIDRPLDQIVAHMSSGRRHSLKKMEEQNFTHSFSRDPADLELFYNEMYVPFISRRHGDRAIIEPFETKQAMFDQGGLIVVKQQGKPVAAALAQVIGDTFVGGSLGVHEQHLDLIPEGVITAVYWFTIVWAMEQGLKYVDFGLTRARLHDGGFWAKLLWGMQVHPNTLDDHTSWLMLANQLHDPLRSFLNKAGFIAQVNGEYRCVILKAQDEQPCNRKVKKTTKLAQQVGLDGLLILPQEKGYIKH